MAGRICTWRSGMCLSKGQELHSTYYVLTPWVFGPCSHADADAAALCKIPACEGPSWG